MPSVLVTGARRDLLGADDMGVQPHVAVLGALGQQHVEAVAVVGQRHAAHMVQPAGQAGDLLEFLVEPDRVALKGGHVGIAVERVKAPRRVPGGARGEIGAFHQHDIGPAQLGQVVEHEAPTTPPPMTQTRVVVFMGGLLRGYADAQTAVAARGRMSVCDRMCRFFLGRCNEIGAAAPRLYHERNEGRCPSNSPEVFGPRRNAGRGITATGYVGDRLSGAGRRVRWATSRGSGP